MKREVGVGEKNNPRGEKEVWEKRSEGVGWMRRRMMGIARRLCIIANCKEDIMVYSEASD
jgi:hypothetical protein